MYKRQDQFMRLGWKLLIPLTLAWVVLVAFMRAAALGWFGTSTVVTLFGLSLIHISEPTRPY